MCLGPCNLVISIKITRTAIKIEIIIESITEQLTIKAGAEVKQQQQQQRR